MHAWKAKLQLSRQDVAKILEDFLEGKGRAFDWDDFISGPPITDCSLEEIRVRSSGLCEEFPPDTPNKYCSEQGIQILRDYIKQLRAPQ